MRTILIGGLTALLAVIASADTLQMSSGSQIECVILQENKDSVVIQRGYGTLTYPRSQVVSITRSPVLTESSIAPTTKPVDGQRIPAWNNVLAALVKSKWATNLQQIPATVVDVGVMRAVPYQSYRCGADYEVNIYGDPDHPAGIEIGVYRTLLNSGEAKRNCIEFMASVLTDKTDAAVVRAVNQTKDLVTRNELSIEVTPSSDPDAYGGWWVSVYSEKELEKSRATDDELKQITVARPVTLAAKPSSRTPTTTRVAVSPTTQPFPVPSPVVSDAWTPADMTYSRPSRSSGGSVYVKGYYRKNGTYVHSYTRRR